MKWCISLLAILAMVASTAGGAFATGKVNPTRAEWDAPLTNTDTSALIDLAGYDVWVASVATPATPAPPFPGSGWVKITTVIAASPTPVAGTHIVWPFVGITGAGQRYITVTAVDLTGVSSAAATPFVPFVLKAPGVPQNLVLP